jgi:hypothetical protein
MWESMILPLLAALQAGGAILQWHGSGGGRDEPATLVIRDQRSWVDIWTELKQDPPQPTLDDKHMAVVIFSGTMPTAGYTVSVRGAHEENGRDVVEYVETGPARDRMVAQVLTHPWVVAILPATTLPVIFKKLPP